MKRLLPWTILLLLTLTGLAAAAGPARIARVENGLVPFNPGAPAGETPAPANLKDRMAHYKIPGVSIAVIENNRVEWAKGYGVLKAGGSGGVTPGSLFEAASTTKMLVAAVVLKLVEKGRLDLDTDVNRYLKIWKIPENEFTKDKKITLRLLLTHQAGLPMTNFGYDDGQVPSLVQVLAGQAPARNKPAVPESVPGSRWNYSNIGYVLIQQVLEDVTGQPLPRLMQKVLFKPLKMKSSTFTYPLPANRSWQEAWPHAKDGQPGEPAMHPTALAQGGLMTTPSELAAVVIELMRDYRGEGRKLLSRPMMEKMFHREVEIDPRVMGVPLGQGLGVFLQGAGTGFTFGHPGENYPGTTCWVTGLPGHGKGLAVMANGAAGTMLAMEILAAVRQEYGWPAGH